MRINIKATNFDLTPSLKKYIEDKIGDLEKFIQKVGKEGRSFKKGKPPCEAWVEVGRTTFHHRKGEVFRAEVQLKVPGKSLRAEAEQEDLHAAINEVRDDLQRELRKYTNKAAARYKRGARRIKEFFRFAPSARFRKRFKRKK